MSENIDNSDLLGSGGHVWAWESPQVSRKHIGPSAGLVGVFSMTTAIGARRGRVMGRAGGPAVLKASGGSRPAADDAMKALEAAIEAVILAGDPVGWEDDQGNTGTQLLVLDYRRQGPRLYGASGGNTVVWQNYTLTFQENSSVI